MNGYGQGLMKKMFCMIIDSRSDGGQVHMAITTTYLG